MSIGITTARSRAALALAGILAVGAVGLAGCGSSSSDATSTAAAEAALSADLQAAYAKAEEAVTKAEDAVVEADDADAAIAAWPALETEITNYEKTLKDIEAGATGACLAAVKAYAVVEEKEHVALKAIYTAATEGDPDSFSTAVTDYTTLVASTEVKDADAALAADCGVTVG